MAKHIILLSSRKKYFFGPEKKIGVSFSMQKIVLFLGWDSWIVITPQNFESVFVPILLKKRREISTWDFLSGVLDLFEMCLKIRNRFYLKFWDL